MRQPRLTDIAVGASYTRSKRPPHVRIGRCGFRICPRAGLLLLHQPARFVIWCRMPQKARRNPRRKGARPRKRPTSNKPLDDEGCEPLRKAEVRELQRRLEDSRDPTRYLLVSAFGPRFKLYYNLSDDVFAINEPRCATLFKRREAALAVQRLLDSQVKIIRCSTRMENGERVPVLGKPSSRARGRKK